MVGYSPHDIEIQRANDHLHAEIRMSCANAALIIRHFSDKHGVSPEGLLRGLSVSEKYIQDSANWLNNLDTYKFFHNCQHSVKGFTHRDWIEVGRSVYRNRISRFFKTIIRLIRLSKVYARVPVYNERMSKISNYTILQQSSGFIRYKFELPDKIRALYTIGCECNWHVGILSALPKIQNPSDRLSKTSHEICAMQLPHILMWSYELFAPVWEIGQEGLRLNKDLIANWVRLKREKDGSLSGRYEFTEMKRADAMVVLQDVKLGGRVAFRQGEIYGAPYCVFSVKYREMKPLRRVLPMRSGISDQMLENQLLAAERKFLEAEELRKRERENREILETTNKRLEETSGRLEYLDHLLDIEGIKPLVFDSRLRLVDIPRTTERLLRLIYQKDDGSMLRPFQGWIRSEIAPTGGLQAGTGPWEKMLKFQDIKVRCRAHVVNGHSGHPLLIIQLQEQSRTENFEILKNVDLTRREIEVVEYLPLGYTNKQIAAAMGIKEVSVKKHLKNVAQKLHASCRTEILYQALKANKDLQGQ